MTTQFEQASQPHVPGHRIARVVLVSFVLTFLVARLVVLLMMSRWMPDLSLALGETRVHHLSYGIIMLSAVAGYSVLVRPQGRTRTVVAALYGIALALTFDEFGLWINLGGSYWQTASITAVAIVGLCLAVLSFSPALRRLRARHWAAACVLLALLAGTTFVMARAVREDTIQIGELLREVERTGPL